MARTAPTSPKLLPLAVLWLAASPLLPARAAETRVASAGPDTSAAFAQARAIFDRGVEGDTAATEQAHAAFQKLNQADPQNVLWQAYYGSSFAQLARDAWAPWSKMSKAEKGLALLDKAVAQLTPELEETQIDGLPVALQTRLVAAATYLSVPDLFHHFEAAKATLDAAFASPAFPKAPPELRAGLWMQAARSARKQEKAAEELAALRQVVAASPQGPSAKQATKRLAELGR